MAVVRYVNDLPHVSTLTLIARVRFGSGAKGNTHLFDFDEGQPPYSQVREAADAESWQRLVIDRGFGALRQRDYFAVGVSETAAGDNVDIRDVRIMKGIIPQQLILALADGFGTQLR